MLVELGLVEQRYQAVLEVLNDGAAVVDVARRCGVARQTVHDWLRGYAVEGSELPVSEGRATRLDRLGRGVLVRPDDLVPWIIGAAHRSSFLCVLWEESG
jgi:hypothetical protein